MSSSAPPQFTLNYLNKLVSQKSSWTITLDIPIDPMMKYAGFTTYNDLVAAYPDYLNDITEEGAWNYYLTNLLVADDGSGNEGDEMLAKSLFYRGYDFSGDEPVPLETVNLTSFNVNLPALTDGRFMFYGTPITSFNSEMPNLEIGYSMFANCPNLTEWTMPLEKLQFGDYMFARSAINSRFPSLPALKSGSYMFDSSAMTSWDTNLPVLEYGDGMFQGSSLTYFIGNLGNLTYAGNMFSGTPLETFETEDLSLLNNAEGMFERCSSLTSFNINLPSLINGYSMFSLAEIGDTDGLSSFESYSPLLENGVGMFRGQKNLSKVAFNVIAGENDGDNCFYLPALKYGDMMFAGCRNLEILVTNTKDFSSLENASYMFAGTHFRGGGNFITFLNTLKNLPGSSMKGEIHLTVEFLRGSGDSSYFYNQDSEPDESSSGIPGVDVPPTMDDLSDEYPSYNHDKDPTSQEWLTRYIGGWKVHVNKY